MKISSEFSVRSCGKPLVLSFLIAVCCLLPMMTFGADKWPGIDESVVEKYAKEQGREAHEPLINIGQGDLRLFVFLLAGAAGGFGAGYYWRKLISEKKSADAKNKL